MKTYLNRPSTSANQGFVLPTLLISATFIIIIGLLVSSAISTNFLFAAREVYRVNAQFAVDAGIDKAIAELNIDGDWAGTAGEVTLFSDSEITTTYEVDVVDGVNETSKTLEATGRTYRASSSSPSSSVSYNVDLYSIGGNSGNLSIITGVGGLYMQNSAKIVDGNVFVNGELEMRNSAQIGLSNNPVSVSVAHQNCPTSGGESYPQVCTSGQPIDISSPAHIYGNVCATNQTSGSGMSSAGLTAGCDVEPQALPDYDRAAQVAAVGNTISGDLTCSGSQIITVPANTRVTGNMETRNSCKVYLEGNLWVEGNLSMANGSELYAPDSAGEELTTVMVDGSDGASLINSASILPNSAGVGVRLITFYSRAACSPDCADVTGQDLYESRNDITIRLNNSAEAASSVLYARWSRASLSNGGDVGAVAGQSVALENSASVTFGATLGEGETSSVFWLVEGYRRN